jgi:hypothetical protein
MEGLNIGCIRKTRTPSDKDEGGDLEYTIDTFFDWLNVIESIGGDMHENRLAFAEILTVGRYGPSNGKSRDKLGGVIGVFARWSTKTKPDDPVPPRLTEYMEFHLDISEEEFALSNEKKIRNASKWIRDRCLFLSDSGTFGLAPGFAVAGDLLCIPFGCLTPLVLRPCENYYTVIGEAYVHGFMRGEAIKLLEKGDLKVQEFEVH